MFPATRIVFALAVLGWDLCCHAQQQPEFRALWADTFHAGMRSSGEVTALVNAARSGNFNAVIVEVRKRGDAYYNSNFEPKATDVSPQSFDPLADLITKAHSGGPRIEVHAWITTYLAWNSQSPPPQSTHPLNLHPEWLSVDNTGANWDGANYQFDQALPEVQQHVYNVSMDIISRYDVDGFHFDYVRYTGKEWGYHSNAVDRFNRRFNRSGVPSLNDSAWLQFRRDQVSDLVRKIYLNTMAVKPQVKLSAATICFAPGVSNDAQWYSSSAAWNDVLQDWRGWMQEGTLDLAVPMMYFDQRRYSNDWSAWSIFAKDHAFGHHVALGHGSYLNTLSNSLVQLRSSRVATSGGNAAHGVALYSYAVPGTNVTFTQLTNALTKPSTQDTNPIPLFTNAVATPVMSWKATPTLGHLKGIVTLAGSNELDGAVVSIFGPASAARTNDATGFYGFVHLQPGNYAVTASFSNCIARTTNVTIEAGAVQTVNFVLVPTNSMPATNSPISTLAVFPGRTEAIVAWTTLTAADAQVQFGLTTNIGDATWRTSWRDPESLTNHAMFVAGLAPNTNYFVQAISRAGTNVWTSPLATFATAGDIVIDNADAFFSGSWSTGTSSLDKFGSNYLFGTSGSGGTATFRPEIATPGFYDVLVWYPQGGNRPTNAPFVVSFDGGSVSGTMNQTTNGGGWRLVAANKPFARGTSGYFQWQTIGAEAGKVVLADAVRFSYVTNQEPSAPGATPRWWSEFFSGVSASSDTDDDGLSAADEYIAGTDPLRPSSKLTFGILDRTNNIAWLSFAPFHSGRVYELQAASTLGTNASWTIWSTNALPYSASAGVFNITNDGSQSKFYRLHVRQ
jgi:uncharacterized lipoprotein YddW (UPF0748 family)